MKSCTKFVVSLLLTAMFVCTSAFTAPQQEEKGKKFGGVTITVSACVEAVWDTVRKPAISEFEAATGMKVVVDDVGFNALREKHVAECSAKTGALDVLYIIEPFVAEYVNAGFLLPVKKVMTSEEMRKVKEEFFPSLVKVATFDDELYGIPGSVMKHGVVINTALFEKAGVAIPKTWTWESLLEAGRKIHNPPDVYGFALPAGRTGTTQEMFEEFMMTTGGKTFDKNWKPQYSSPEGLKTLKFWLELFKISPPESVNWWWLDIWAALQTGRAAMTYGTTIQEISFNDPDWSEYAGNFQFIPMPVPKDRIGKPFTSRVNTVSWVITEDSKNPEAAWEFIKWMNGFAMKKREALEGGGGGTFDSARRAYYQDPEILAERPFLKGMDELLENAETMPLIPEMPQIIEILTLHLNEAVLGTVSPEEALKKVDEEVEALMAEGGYY